MASGIHVLLHFRHTGVGSGHGELNRLLHLRLYLRLNETKLIGIRKALFDQPTGQQLDGISLRLPVLLLILRAVVLAIDIANVVPGVAIRIAQNKRWPTPAT